MKNLFNKIKPKDYKTTTNPKIYGRAENPGVIKENPLLNRKGIVPRFGYLSNNDKAQVTFNIFCLCCKKMLGPKARVIIHKPLFVKKSMQEKSDTSGCNNSLKTNVSSNLCDGIFIKRFDWAGNNDPLSISGKINCPACNFHIGEYKLSGIKCSCGHIEAPSYMLRKNKIFYN